MPQESELDVLVKESKKFTEDNFENPEPEDYLLIQTAFLHGSIITRLIDIGKMGTCTTEVIPQKE